MVTKSVRIHGFFLTLILLGACTLDWPPPVPAVLAQVGQAGAGRS
jgi:hypothetical protein